MRRLSYLVALLALALTAALILGPSQLRTGAQSGTPAAPATGFVGAWRVTVSSPDLPVISPYQSLSTFMVDGTFLDSDSPVFPGDGAPLRSRSTGHGVWRQTGPTTADVVFVMLEADAQGHFHDTVTIRERLTLGADGNSFSGPFSLTVADPSGAVFFQGAGTVSATRITLQPLASPGAGTPAA